MISKAEAIERVRAHAANMVHLGRATFSLDGIMACLAEIDRLRADKSLLMAAMSFAEECDEPQAFLSCWMDGSADVDEEWKDWQEFKANLVLDGKVADQPLAAPALQSEARDNG